MTDAPRSPEQAAAAAERFRADFEGVREQIGRVIVGQGEIIEGVLICLFVGGHCLLEGVPGIGKTLLVRTLSRAVDLKFGRVQFTPDLMPADITGTTVVYEGEGGGGGLSGGSAATGRPTREFRFQPGPLFAQIVLADEINRATPKTQSALLEAMQERSVTVAGVTHPLPRPFFVMATQNPVEQEGTYPLPEAQLDRFFFKLLVGSPTRDELAQILARTTMGSEAEVRAALDGPRLLEHQALIREVAIADHVQDYAIRMVLATHPKSSGGGGAGSASTARFGGDPSAGIYATPMTNQFVRMGASPRAAQALVLAAKCRALIQGRPAAGVDDVRAVALPALRHRLILNFEAEAEGITHDAVVTNIVQTLPVEA